MDPEKKRLYGLKAHQVWQLSINQIKTNTMQNKTLIDSMFHISLYYL